MKFEKGDFVEIIANGEWMGEKFPEYDKYIGTRGTIVSTNHEDNEYRIDDLTILWGKDDLRLIQTAETKDIKVGEKLDLKPLKSILKDSGNRTVLSGNMLRDFQEGRERFDLLLPELQKYDETWLYKLAKHYSNGAKKYSDRNWEQACGEDNYDSFRQSAMRHFFQYLAGDESEDHMSATIFNLVGMDYVKWRMQNGK